MTSLLNYLIRQILITWGSPLEKWKNKYSFPFLLRIAGEENGLSPLLLPVRFVSGMVIFCISVSIFLVFWTASENSRWKWGFIFSINMVKKSWCCIKSRKKAVNEAKCWTMMEVVLASLMHSFFLLVSLSSDYNLFFRWGHCWGSVRLWEQQDFPGKSSCVHWIMQNCRTGLAL